MLEEGTFFTTFITEGSNFCFSSSRVTFEANYPECDIDGITIKRVEIEHSVNGKRKSKRTERQALYYLYGDTFLVDGNIGFREAIEGENKLTAKANRGKPQEINFTLRKCP